MNRIQDNPRLTAFVGLILGSGCVLLFLRGEGFQPSAEFLIWFFACLAGEIFWIRTPTGRGTISMALTINLAAVIVLKPGVALPAIALSTLAAGLCPHRRPLHRCLFNAAQSVIAASAAIVTLKLLNPMPDRLSVMNNQTTWIALFAAGIAFFMVNTFVVAMVIALQNRQSLFRAWRENYGYGFELACALALISLTGFVEMAYRQMGSVTIFFLLPTLAVFWWSSDREARALRAEGPEPVEEEFRKAG